MKIVLKLSLAFLFYGGLAHGQTCHSTKSLQKGGWTLHPSSNFATLSKKVVDQFNASKANYTQDMQTRLYSRNAHRSILVTSFDSKLTPQDEMFGDIFFIEDLNTGELMELRWFAGGKRQIVYNEKVQPCPENWIPWAENSLY